MRIIYHPGHHAHNPPLQIFDGVEASCPETPARAEAIAARLTQDPRNTFNQPRHFSKTHITRIHHPAYAQYLQDQSQALKEGATLYPSYFITDTYAPITHGTYQAAVQSVHSALTGASLLIQGQKAVYCLCRPPGHHAARTSMGGFCYFNNAAISANYLARNGKVAIVDIDLHHGNGTQDSFYDRSDVLYVSLHVDPLQMYPYISGFANEHGAGDGRGYTHNYPLPLGTNDATYLKTLAHALQRVRQFRADYLIVSAGFDTYAHDPMGGFRLSAECYTHIGQAIAALQLPTLIVQEGGYNIAALGDLAHNLLEAFQLANSN